jgi:hypothetical protein
MITLFLKKDRQNPAYRLIDFKKIKGCRLAAFFCIFGRGIYQQMLAYAVKKSFNIPAVK